jgi:hypothetical protein
MDRIEKIIAGIFGAIICSGLIIGTCLLFVENSRYYTQGAELLAAMACSLAIVLFIIVLDRCIRDE